MFNVDTTKKPRPIKKPIPVRINKNNIDLKGNSNVLAKVSPQVNNSGLVQSVSARPEQELDSSIMFEVY